MNLFEKIQSRLSEYIIEPVTLNNLTRYEPVFYTNVEYYTITEGHSATEQDCVETVEYMNDFPPDTCYSIGFSKEDQAVAFLSLFEGDPEPETVYIGLFLINTPFQRKAIGTTIMETIIDESFRLGYHALKLSVQSNNISGYSFWQKMGFKVVAETQCDGFINYSMELTSDI